MNRSMPLRMIDNLIRPGCRDSSHPGKPAIFRIVVRRIATLNFGQRPSAKVALPEPSFAVWPLHFRIIKREPSAPSKYMLLWVQVARIVWQPNHGIICDGGRLRALNGHWRPAKPKERECFREPRQYLNQQRRSKD